MSAELIVHRAGPGVSVQDRGRTGYLAMGLSRGGAADLEALSEGAALLGQPDTLACLEMAGMGGEFEVTADTRIALTGAPMRVTLDGAKLAWHASHLMPKGARLSIGPVESGSYGYLHLGGGLDTPQTLGARSTHFAAGVGQAVAAGDRLALGPDHKPQRYGFKLRPEARFDGGKIRILPSLQTDFFEEAERARFETTSFTRDSRGNRMGVRMIPGDKGFDSPAGLKILSEVITPGDIQVTGDGTPFVLLSESQTTGGYPRIGTVLPSDLPRVAQAPAGAKLHFVFVTEDEALEIEARAAKARKSMSARCERLVRRPEDIPDLLSYQLISGVTAGYDQEEEPA